MKRFLLALLLVPSFALASADSEWVTIVAMDSGPTRKPATEADVKLIARQHLSAQRALLSDFLAKYPDDARAFDARLRLAAILATIGKMDGVQRPVDDAMRMLIELEKIPGIPMAKRADAAFQRVSLYFQSMRGRESEMRGAIVDSARNFAANYPGDRRGPRLLVEAATICDGDPKLKREILEQARDLSREEGLNQRIADDLMRLGLLGRPFSIKFPSIQGKMFDSAEARGSVLVLIFWSAESPHCLIWLPEFVRGIRQIPGGRVRIATVAVDNNRADVAKRMNDLRLGEWPTFFDGEGWQSPMARDYGINSLPTVFVIDQRGVLRSINARENYDLVIRSLLRE